MKHDYCVACGNKENLHQHHLIPKAAGGSDKRDNLLTLCIKHHALIHENLSEWSSSALIRKGMERAKRRKERVAELSTKPTNEQVSYKELYADISSVITFENSVAAHFTFVVDSYLNQAYTEAEAVEHMKEVFVDCDYPHIKKSRSDGIGSILIDLITDRKIRKRLLKIIKKVPRVH